jgi:hypothetical protein
LILKRQKLLLSVLEEFGKVSGKKTYPTLSAKYGELVCTVHYLVAVANK